MAASNPKQRLSRRAGQTAVEFALLYSAVVIPLTFGIVYVAQMYWVWHSAAEFTRQGAHYAATHCWQGGGDNVLTYMRTHVPVNMDQDQFTSGSTDPAAKLPRSTRPAIRSVTACAPPL